MTNDTAPSPPAAGKLDRRSVVRTAAWSLPVIAVSAQAPAFAASCNQLYTGQLNPVTQYTKLTPTTARAVVPLSGTGGSVTIDFLTIVTTDYAPSSANYTVAPQVGGTGLPGIQFGYDNTNTDGSSGQHYRTRLTFSRNVSDLSFLVTDLDNTGTHDERLAILGPAFTRSFPAGSNCVGAGTTTNPIRNAVPGDPNPVTGNAGNVRIRVAGPTTSVTLQFWTAELFPSNSNNWLTDMSFSALSNGCP